jgi:hypothetical protein
VSASSSPNPGSTQSGGFGPHPSVVGDAEREAFAAARAGALRVLAGEPDLTVFATWCLGLLQGVAPGGLRHAACDGVLSALAGEAPASM